MRKKFVENKKLGYKLTRSDCGGWLFLGTELKEILLGIEGELQADLESGMTAEDLPEFIISPVGITQDEIDQMPEFPGW